jgi:hypothetical protein
MPAKVASTIFVQAKMVSIYAAMNIAAIGAMFFAAVGIDHFIHSLTGQSFFPPTTNQNGGYRL